MPNAKYRRPVTSLHLLSYFCSVWHNRQSLKARLTSCDITRNFLEPSILCHYLLKLPKLPIVIPRLCNIQKSLQDKIECYKELVKKDPI